eukprot:CAMPEP_0205877930 /NCGR_PEP_ID=MMETSP1083-20121108/14582_1 /ASSEMBLY_ACC=CAM_ASM_000430 /TAXON_ID=97485 /ORGANISM="Prymnesium parvum, Strain Texoma1" /LENGTH=304 /DNA_ID=CAMNT_0053240767 /DNA_START=106 /DNA_END=1021 /DNA_ORIENTATION=+
MPALRHYERIQFIAFEICTMPHDFKTAPKEDFYLGARGDVIEDMRLRAAMVSIAFEAAAESDRVDQSEKCLKLFMVPEFFWRGPCGKYDVDKVLAALRHLTIGYSAEAYRSWMFVFGTVCAYDQPDFMTSWGEDEFVSFNLDPRLGGLADGEVARLSANTEFMKTLPKAANAAKMDDHGVFNSRGTTFGLEFCLDHAVGRLSQAKHKDDVRVHLLSTCGMSVNSAYAVGELIFHCDGLTDGGEEYGSHSSAFQRQPDGTLAPIYSEDYQYVLGDGWQDVIKNLFFAPPETPPAIRVYQAVDMPK